MVMGDTNASSGNLHQLCNEHRASTLLANRKNVSSKNCFPFSYWQWEYFFHLAHRENGKFIFLCLFNLSYSETYEFSHYNMWLLKRTELLALTVQGTVDTGQCPVSWLTSTHLSDFWITAAINTVRDATC